MNLLCVPPDRAAEAWPHARGWVKAAMDGVDVGSFIRTEADVLRGANLLWLASDGSSIQAAAVTDIHTTERRKVCVIVACGGVGMKDWLHLIAGLEAYARREGCSATRIIGRKGWARALDGYHEQAVVLERTL